MDYAFQGGAVSKSIELFIMDSGSSPVGMGKTGLVFNTAGLVISYRRPGDAAYTNITLVTLASPSAAYSSGGFVQIDSTNAPGKYRLDLPNAAINSGVQTVEIQWKGTGIVDDWMTIGLLPYDPTTVDKTGYALSAAGMDPVLDSTTAIEGSTFTWRNCIRLVNSALFGKSSGVDTGSPVYRDLADTKNRIAATSTNGNRTAYTTRDGT